VEFGALGFDTIEGLLTGALLDGTLIEEYTLLLIADTNEETSEVGRIEARFRMYISSKHKYAAVARAFVTDREIDKRFNVPLPSEAA